CSGPRFGRRLAVPDRRPSRAWAGLGRRGARGHLPSRVGARWGHQRRCLVVARPAFIANGSAPPEPAVTVPPAGLEVTASNGDANVSVRLFGDELRPLGTIAFGSSLTLRVPPDHSRQPWRLSVQTDGRA